MNHEGLDEVTKLSISHFENTYSYDAFLEDKANKDNKFAQEKEEEEQKKEENEEKKEGDEGSEFSLSGAESDLERTMESWDRSKAETLYKQMEEELQGHCL
jgi:hypothetical protein